MKTTKKTVALLCGGLLMTSSISADSIKNRNFLHEAGDLFEYIKEGAREPFESAREKFAHDVKSLKQRKTWKKSKSFCKKTKDFCDQQIASLKQMGAFRREVGKTFGDMRKKVKAFCKKNSGQFKKSKSRKGQSDKLSEDGHE